MITISTRLLEAIAKWAADDSATFHHHLQQIRFRDGEAISTDGCRLARVPTRTGDHDIGLWRHDAIAAIAAQRALKAGPQLAIEPDGHGRLVITLSASVSLRVQACTASMPGRADLDVCFSRSSERAPTPEGFCFNLTYLDAVNEVCRAITPHQGARIVQWGNPLDPVVFEGPEGSRFVVMPMKVPE